MLGLIGILAVGLGWAVSLGTASLDSKSERLACIIISAGLIACGIYLTHQQW